MGLYRLRVSKGRLDPESADAHYNRQRSLAAYGFTKPYLSNRFVLDAGCGGGHGTLFLSQEAKRVIGTDLDFAAVRYARARSSSSHLHFVCSDLLRMPYPSETFDVVVSFQVVEHLPYVNPYFQEVRRVLKRDGLFFLATLNRDQTTAGLNPHHPKEYTFSEFRQLVSAFFPAASFYGLFGNERYLSVRREEARFGSMFLKMDPWGLRRRLPHALWEWIYAFCTLCVNRYVSWRKPVAKELTTADFEVRSSTLEKAIDFIALCRKE